MGLIKYSFYLDNELMQTPPSNWQGLEVLATFLLTDEYEVKTSETIQPNITIDKFTFTNENAQKIINYRKGAIGVTTPGIFEGMPFKIEISNGTTTSVLFDGFLDFKKEYSEVSPVKVECKIKELDNLNAFDDRVRVNSFEYLESIGVFNADDFVNVPFIVERLDNESEQASLELMIALFIIQAAQLTKEIGKDIATITAIASTITGIPGSLVLAVVTLVLDIIFLLILLTELINLLIRMVELIAPPVQFHKGAYVKTLLEKAFDFLGYEFETNLEELNNLVYLPSRGSNINQDGTLNPIQSGVPKLTESGETISDLINLVLRTFNGRIAIIDNVVQIRTDADAFWIKTSTYKLPDVGNQDSTAIDLQSEEAVFNTDELRGSTFVGFITDPSDQWTLEDDEGTDAQAIREPILINDEKMLLFDGFERVDIPIALGSRKSVLSRPEELLEQLQSALAPIINQANLIFGNQIGANLSNVGVPIPSQYSNLFNYLNTNSRIGALRISSKAYNVAKFLYMEEVGNELKIPEDYKEKFSAVVMYNKYHISNSFADINDFKRQRRVFNERTIPFSYSDFLKVTNNSYFSTNDGKIGKIDTIKWKLDADTAIVSYWVEEVYTENIKEVVIQTT